MISPHQKLFATLKSLASKYLQSLPVEFVGVAVFARASFFPDSELVHLIEIETTLKIIGVVAAIELFHYYIQPVLRGRRLSDAAGMVIFVFITIGVFFVWLIAYFIAYPEIRQ